LPEGKGSKNRRMPVLNLLLIKRKTEFGPSYPANEYWTEGEAKTYESAAVEGLHFLSIKDIFRS